ncbi:E3 ubiquitin-protein ligase PUB24 [Rhodamnia argentea]|uniref:U-box domain-containing protein n=1 Tax=Rhodamnia argentea TaxID=178133 RepID=A0A8B8R5N0_9MYRT|nr:E3 ubiquitin-protein ligase PUB24 [Rhodamnia argentea]
MENVLDVPEYFTCPISLQLMRDPVTAVTGITYERESIERWLSGSESATCPVTKQPLAKGSNLTPNHTLRRLIQSWCDENASQGVHLVPTPRAPLDRSYLLKLVGDIQCGRSAIDALRRIEMLVVETERNRTDIVEAGVPKAILSYVAKCCQESRTVGLEEALSILVLLRVPSTDYAKLLLGQNDRIIKSLTWVLGCEVHNRITVRSHALIVLKTMIKAASSSVLERLESEFFRTIIGLLRNGITRQAQNALLQTLLYLCPWGRNRATMVEHGAVFELVELELGFPEKKTTELILGVLFHLCSCAEGRAQFIGHRCGIAVVLKRILNVSHAVDERAVLILSNLSKSSGNSMFVREMLVVGAVPKLCLLLQADCATYLKDRAREILKTHFDEWKKSPCIDDTLLTRVTR